MISSPREGPNACVCVCVFVCMKEGERERKTGDGKRDAESIDVCLHHVADRGGSGETDGLFIPQCVCMCVLTGYPT